MIVIHDFLGRSLNPAPLDVLACPHVTYWEPGQGWIKGKPLENGRCYITLEEVPSFVIQSWIRARADKLGAEEGAFVLLGAVQDSSRFPSLFGLYHDQIGHESETWYDSPVAADVWPGVPTYVRPPTIWEHLGV